MARTHCKKQSGEEEGGGGEVRGGCEGASKSPKTPRSLSQLGAGWDCGQSAGPRSVGGGPFPLPGPTHLDDAVCVAGVPLVLEPGREDRAQRLLPRDGEVLHKHLRDAGRGDRGRGARSIVREESGGGQTSSACSAGGRERAGRPVSKGTHRRCRGHGHLLRVAHERDDRPIGEAARPEVDVVLEHALEVLCGHDLLTLGRNTGELLELALEGGHAGRRVHGHVEGLARPLYGDSEGRHRACVECARRRTDAKKSISPPPALPLLLSLSTSTRDTMSESPPHPPPRLQINPARLHPRACNNDAARAVRPRARGAHRPRPSPSKIPGRVLPSPPLGAPPARGPAAACAAAPRLWTRRHPRALPTQ
jgi:hypothetical protein